MSVREEFCRALDRVLPAEPGIAVIHSSLPHLIPPAGFTPWDALYAIGSLVQRGWTIALPAFTFSFCRNGAFDLHHTRSEVGILADWLLAKFPESRRTPHPIYSFAVLGPAADDIAVCPSSTTFGDDSPFGLFERENACLVMLGCGWNACTQFHRYEELARVPYRYFKEFSGIADLGSGVGNVTAAMYVRDLDLEPENDYAEAEAKLRSKGVIATAPLLRGTVESVTAADFAATMTSMFQENPWSLLREPKRVQYALAARTEAQDQPPLRLTILGSSNVHRLELSWQEQLALLLPERQIEFYSLPYGQMGRELMDPSSELHAFSPHFRVFCDRIEDIGGLSDDAQTLVAAVQNYANLIRASHLSFGGWTVVHRFALLTPSRNGVEVSAWASQIARLNALLEEAMSGLDQIIWVDVGAEAAAHADAVLDPRLWYLGRFPYSESFSLKLARIWTSYLLATIGKSVRLVIVDLDQTLWGGILGEDGIEGIQIGGDYPGNAYADFQRALKALAEEGVALAISSKNDEDLALRAFDELPFMVLCSKDFIARRINWQSKWSNIQEIADELNLGLGSVLFIDDNPVECEQVRRNLPAVKVLELPTDPADYTAALAACPYLAVAAQTAEDRTRLQNLRARSEMQASARQAANLDEYLASLGMKLHLQQLDTGNAQRAAQLCQKTNQFNSTTRRYALEELRRLQDDGADVVVIGLEDNYSQYENIGLLVMKADGKQAGVIDLYLLSCRVLGRGLETAIPRWARMRAAERGWKTLRAEIIETERNTPVRSVFADADYEAAGPGVWVAATNQVVDLPSSIKFIDAISTKNS